MEYKDVTIKKTMRKCLVAVSLLGIYSASVSAADEPKQSVPLD
ncbi:hypothetical protein; putative signal peptide [Pseudomonas entomophila L48]|uniref:Uncharacterized protein n=1 Tax=Pseudomonas entomophila (strain L48) TaxID=384676 RepID=Q1IBA6_PSEE4|nr:hypothetical protein; putative signal peptide [Pseudomonas entomophila L48]